MNKRPLAVLIAAISAFILCACNSNSETTETKTTSPSSPEIKSVFVNGDSLHYVDIGKGEPVIFVHGTTDDYRLWNMQMDTFAKDHRVIAYSRRYAYPNRQVTNDTADYSPAIHAKDLAQFIKSFNIGPVHIVGHSYGAYVALLTTLEHPELVKTLMLGEPPIIPLVQNVPGGDTLMSNFISAGISPAAEAFRSGNNEKGVSIFLGGVSGDSSIFSKIPAEAQSVIMSNALELRGIALSKNVFVPVSCDDLKKVTTPVLIMTGEKTLLLFKTINKELSRCLTNKEEVILSNATHGLETENPVDFNKMVLAFIDKHSNK